MKYTLLSMVLTEAYWHIHCDGCAEIAKQIRYGNVNYIDKHIKAESAKALVQAELKDSLSTMGYDESDFKIMGCCK